MKLRSVLAAALAGTLAGTLVVSQGAFAQMPAAPRQPGPPPTAQKAALIDLAGNWVSVVDQDWRWRMITPAKGDYTGVPLNAAGRRIADQFNPALYGGATAIVSANTVAGGLPRTTQEPVGRYQLSGVIDCRAYGAAALMHMPTRLRVSWQDPNTLKLETDWGEQTRLLHFIPDHPYADPQLPLMVQALDAAGMNGAPPAAQAYPPGSNRASASLQGYSVAVWEQPYPFDGSAFQRGPQNNRLGGLNGSLQELALRGGDLAVVTIDLAPGWLRRNGVPYGSRTRVIEHYQTFQDPTGRRWFDVATEVIDEEYLNAPFFTTGDFMQEPDGSKWAPHPCKQVTGD